MENIQYEVWHFKNTIGNWPIEFPCHETLNASANSKSEAILSGKRNRGKNIFSGNGEP